jgi:hypothetical protein
MCNHAMYINSVWILSFQRLARLGNADSLSFVIREIELVVYAT